MRSTWFSRVNNSLCLPPYHLRFVLSYWRPTLVWHKSVSKQRVIKETSISKYLHHKLLVPCSESDRTCCLYHGELLLQHVEKYTKKWYNPLSVPRRTASMARWNVHESDTTRRLHHTASSMTCWNIQESDMTCRWYQTKPLVRHVEIYRKVTWPTVCTTQPLVRHIEMYTKVIWPAICTTQPLVRHVKMYTKVTRSTVCTTKPLVRYVEMYTKKWQPAICNKQSR